MDKNIIMLALSRELVLGEMLARQSRNIPNDTVFISKDKKLNYFQFNARVNRLANCLKKNSLKHGDKLSILLHNGNEILEAIFAAGKIGAIAVPINYRLIEKEIEYIIKDSESSALIYDAKFMSTVQKLKGGMKKLRICICVGNAEGIDPGYEKIIAESSLKEPLVMVRDSDPAFIMYTSGTTGRPKGAVTTHKNQLLKANTFSRELGVKEKEIFLCVSPLFHQGPMGLCLMFMMLGGHVVVMDKFTPIEVAKRIDREKPNVVLLVPSMWQSMLQDKNVTDYDKSSIRVGITAGAVAPLSLKKQIAEAYPKIGLFDCFGQTETCGSLIVLKPEYAYIKPDSVGKPMANTEVKIVNENDDDVQVGEIGEIVCRGQAVLKEYYNDAEATKEAMKNGWFHTGDLARKDEDGFFYLVDRKKDMIISGGENIYSAEIEKILQNHPKIEDVAIIGVPSEEYGESVHAVIVAKNGGDINLGEIADYCARYAASYKKPRSMQVVDSLPRNAAGKILKTKLREKAE